MKDTQRIVLLLAPWAGDRIREKRELLLQLFQDLDRQQIRFLPFFPLNLCPPEERDRLFGEWVYLFERSGFDFDEFEYLIYRLWQHHRKYPFDLLEWRNEFKYLLRRLTEYDDIHNIVLIVPVHKEKLLLFDGLFGDVIRSVAPSAVVYLNIGETEHIDDHFFGVRYFNYPENSSEFLNFLRKFADEEAEKSFFSADEEAEESLISVGESRIEKKAVARAVSRYYKNRLQYNIISSKPSRVDNSHGELTFSKSEDIDSEVFFTAYYPHNVNHVKRKDEQERKFWYNLIVYAHLESAQKYINKDAKQFESGLGGKIEKPQTSEKSSRIKRGTPITIVPECDQIQFDPVSLTLKWEGEWVRFIFNFNPPEGLINEVIKVRISIRIGVIEIAHVNFEINLIEHKKEERKSKTISMYKKIFLSYSKLDSDIVQIYKYARSFVTDDVFLDTYSAGQEALAYAIDESDIFHLFWSNNSANNQVVRNSWEYAIKIKCPYDNCKTFIQPTYWNEPISPEPPKELKHLSFKYLPIKEMIMELKLRTPLWERIVACAFGFIFITAILIIALYFPEPTKFQFFVFRIIMALAASGIGAVIPGLINIQMEREKKFFLRAGGAIALFVIIYLIDPPSFIR